MKYKAYNCNSYSIHTIKTNKFKTCHLEIVFHKEVNKEELASYSLLGDLLSWTSSKYPTRKEMSLHLEELYKAFYYCTVAKLGNVITTNFMYDFIDSSYINEKNYLENVISFPFEALLNPNVVNDEFDNNQFDFYKKKLMIDIRSIEENGTRLSLYNALQKMDKNSVTSYRTSGTVEELEKVTPSSLYKTYKDLFKNNKCDIFLIGNLDMDKAVSIIKKIFIHKTINNQKIDFNVNNKVRKKEQFISEKGPFLQSNLVLIYNMVDLTKREKYIVLHVYNYILGSGGLKSKLYSEIREKNSFCYSIESMTAKNDNLLYIHIALDNKNISKCIKMIKIIINNMGKDLITSEDIDNAKSNLEISLKANYDIPINIINNHVFKVINNQPDLDEKFELLKSVNIKEVKELAKKMKLNTIYVLEGKENEEN